MALSLDKHQKPLPFHSQDLIDNSPLLLKHITLLIS